MTVHVGDRDQLSVGHPQYLLEQFLSAATDTDHRHANAIIGPEYARIWIDKHRRSTQHTLLDKIPSGVLRHFALLA
jgi:hypothetical protein